MKKQEYHVTINMVVKAKSPEAAVEKAWDVAHYGAEETLHNIPPKGIEVIWVPAPTLWEN